MGWRLPAWEISQPERLPGGKEQREPGLPILAPTSCSHMQAGLPQPGSPAQGEPAAEPLPSLQTFRGSWAPGWPCPRCVTVVKGLPSLCSCPVWHCHLCGDRATTHQPTAMQTEAGTGGGSAVALSGGPAGLQTLPPRAPRPPPPTSAPSGIDTLPSEK